MNLSVEQLAILLVIGGLAGWIAGLIFRRRGFGVALNLAVGVAGALLGRFLLGVIGFRATTSLALFITALLGAILLVWAVSRLAPGGRKKR